MGAIKTISGLQNFINLSQFRADYNSLTSIDLSNMKNLIYVDVSDNSDPLTEDNSLTEIILSGSDSIEDLRLNNSNFSGGLPSLSNLVNLKYIDLDESFISGSVDLTFSHNMRGFDLSYNLDVTNIIISRNQPLGDGDSIYAYGCSLTESSIDNILVELSNNGIDNGTVELYGENNAIPSSIGLAAKLDLESRGWTVLVNS